MRLVSWWLRYLVGFSRMAGRKSRLTPWPNRGSHRYRIRHSWCGMNQVLSWCWPPRASLWKGNCRVWLYSRINWRYRNLRRKCLRNPMFWYRLWKDSGSLHPGVTCRERSPACKSWWARWVKPPVRWVRRRTTRKWSWRKRPTRNPWM